MPESGGAGLAGVHHVAFGLRDRDAVVNGLLAGQVLGVEAGVGDEAFGAEEFAMELAEVAGDVALVPAVLGSELRGYR